MHQVEARDEAVAKLLEANATLRRDLQEALALQVLIPTLSPYAAILKGALLLAMRCQILQINGIVNN